MEKYLIVFMLLVHVTYCFGLKLQDGDILYWAYTYDSDRSGDIEKVIVDTCKFEGNRLVYKHPTIENEEDIEFMERLPWSKLLINKDSLHVFTFDQDTLVRSDSSYADTTFLENDTVFSFWFDHYISANGYYGRNKLQFSKDWGIREIETVFERTSFEPTPVERFVLIAVSRGKQVFPISYTEPVIIDLIGPSSKSASQSQMPQFEYTISYPENTLMSFYEDPYILIDTVSTFENPVDVSLLTTSVYAGKSIYWTVNVKNSLTDTVWSSHDTLLMEIEEAKDVTILFPKNNSTIYTTNPIIVIDNSANDFNKLVIQNDKNEIVYQSSRLCLSPYTNRYDLHIPLTSMDLIPGNEYQCRIDYTLNDTLKSTSSVFTVAKKELSDLLQFTEANQGLKCGLSGNGRQSVEIKDNSIKVWWLKSENSFYREEDWGGEITFDIKNDDLEVSRELYYFRWDKHTYSRDEYEKEVYYPEGIYDEKDSSYNVLWDSLMFHGTQNLKPETDTNHYKLYTFLHELNTAKYDVLHTNTLKTTTINPSTFTFKQSQNMLHLNIKEDMVLELYNVQGRLLMSKELLKSVKSQSLDLSPFSNNVYVLKLKNAQCSNVYKLRL